jgi:hypothetical protein
MASQAATVDLLVKKAKFEPPVAMAVAEAIENAMHESQFVTVPILDARLAAFQAEFRGDLLRHEHNLGGRLVGVDTKIDTTCVDLERKIDMTRAELDNKMDVGFATLKEIIAALGSQMSSKTDLAHTKAELVRWAFAVAFGNFALGAGAAIIINALQHH